METGAARASTSLKAGRAAYDAMLADFQRRLAAGEMPALDPLDWSSGYNPNDSA